MGAAGTWPGGAGSLRRLGELGAGKTSSTLIPGGTLVSQMMRPRTTAWNESEPDMHTPSFRAGTSLSEATGKGSGCGGGPGRSLGRAGHSGEAGSLISPFLPRVPPLPYGLLRVSESPPAGSMVSARSGEAACAGLDMGTQRSTEEAGEEAGEVPMAAGGAERSTSALLSGLTVGGGSGRMGDPTGMIRSAGRGSPSAAPAPPLTARAQTRRNARRRPLT